MRKDVREFIRRLEAAGLTVESTPGHYRVLRDGKPLRKANGGRSHSSGFVGNQVVSLPEVAEMPQSELDSHTDALLPNIILGLQGKYPFEEWEPFGDPMERFPHTVTAIGTYVEREAERLAVERQAESVGVGEADR